MGDRQGSQDRRQAGAGACVGLQSGLGLSKHVFYLRDCCVVPCAFMFHFNTLGFGRVLKGRLLDLLPS